MNRRRTLWTAATLCIMHCALCISFTSCSSDEQAADQLPAGKYPLELSTANISVEQTRATADNNSFDDGDEVGVKVDGDDNVYTYTVSTDDNSTKLTSTEPYYWRNTDAITVTAWYPFDAINANGVTVHKVQPDQSKGEDYQASDFVKTEATVSFPSGKIEFTHQVAKIIVALSFGNEFSEAEKAETEVSGIFDGTQYIAPNCSIKSMQYQALIMPTKISDDFIKVKVNDATFVYTLKEETEFKAGYEYTYTIKVNKTGIELTGCTIGKWNEIVDETEHEAKSLWETLKAKATKIDLGTIENTTVSGNVMLTGTVENKTITIADGANVLLYNANITTSSSSAIKCEGNATIYLEGENTAKSTGGYSKGVQKCGIEAGGTGTTLTIDGDGSLEATGGKYGAGIGIGMHSNCGNITISGGSVTAKGGTCGAGIGSGNYESSCGDITISGGTVTAEGGQHAAAIGSGQNAKCGDITIKGGTVTATGEQYGAAIGSGYGASCGNITISGGTVTAEGGEDATGIGSGYQSSCDDITISGGKVTSKGGKYAAGIGSGYHYSSCSDITISGGEVTASGGSGAAGIGSGYNISSCNNITISGGEVTAKGGSYGPGIGSGEVGASCGIITITSGIENVTVTKGTGATNYIGAGDNGSTCKKTKIDEKAKKKIVDENGNKIYD